MPILRRTFPEAFVAFEVSGEDAVEFELLESVADDSAGSLGGVAAAPERNTNPIAEFGALMLHVGMEADAATDTAVVAKADGEAEFVFFRDAGEEFAGVLFFVRMRNAQSVRRDFAGADQGDEFGDVGFGESG